ncbi:obscurin-like isoform X1 [Biomphalaria glabrata]|uniref:Obscurin-like isoform X1 n=2 Tax=Biomphalaria TaxID=6525 RepID=A0A9W2ZTA6_BIOGL|nr:obscurin-like isoform X1 [Biomphalaria glabrata]XP_055878113.1 obscurin-like isoform X1 [Biomphalaria glabrata]XP_055878117.1 obscurin-like isoform X1 [Biomphalaria glabrata]XP_055878124.1 obscurin-like isoform X1 [Biomphalaria glabrata]XP_055878127.1 obscurin-like isoform X1 [Biomphalaria glabrata]XP_055878133.1 obscurin-like isoform X1 [Biomphalaria glabrata]XP_055878139.1 obscurin-like isoform X1 [Biomphalaria glabrata]
MSDERFRITGHTIMRAYVCLATFLVVAVAQEAPNRRRRVWDTSENDTSSLPPPFFHPTPERVTSKEGQMAKLECMVENIGTKHVIWRRKSDPNPLTIGRRTFVDDERISVQHIPLQPNWTLLIKQVRLDDAGEYECQVASTDRQLRRSVFLTVKPGKRQKIKSDIKITGKTYVEKGQKIKLICNATGADTTDDLDWFRNGQKLSTNKKITIHKRVSLTDRQIDSVLEVQDADLDDAGVYVCRTSELLVESKRVDVLNGTHFSDTNNVKRGTEKDSDGESSASGKQEQLSNTENHAWRLTPSCSELLLVVFFAISLSHIVHNFRLPT